MKLERILVGVDFSPESDVAVRCAMGVARHVGAELALLHAGPVPDEPIVLPEFIPPAENELREKLQEQLRDDRRRLEDMRQRLSGQGVELSHVFIDGNPHDGIARAAEEMNADLVIVGTHGRTGIERFALGSVAERVVRGAPCSVLVARRGPDVFERVLAPVDLTDGSDSIVEAAVDLTASGGEVTVLHGWHVGESLYGLNAPIDEVASPAHEPVRRALGERVERAGRELVARHGRVGLDVRFESVESPPAYAIQEWLDNCAYDLVVLGTHGRRGLKRLLLGSVAERTIRHAKCSAMVVR